MVISPKRTAAVVFLEGDYFLVLSLYGITGTENEATTFTDLGTLVAGRKIALN
jgi:hypothetical protein